MTAIEHGVINAEEILQLCERSFIESAEHHEDLDSTNTRALALISDIAPPSGAHLIYTEQQLAGRGRQGNHWFSAPGSLTFSLIINRTSLDLPAEKVPLMGLAAGVAVLEAGKHFLPQGEFGLKWPNDVHLNGRKVCGILVEPPPGLVDRLVIGIGLNVGNSLREAPEELRSIATSIIDEAGRAQRLHEVLECLLNELSEQFRTLGQEKLPLRERWQQQCVLTGKDVVLQSGDHRVEGRCQGIADSGALLIASHGEPRAHFGGTVRLK